MPIRPKFAAGKIHFLCGLAVFLMGAVFFSVAPAEADTVNDVTNIQAGGYGGFYIGNRAPLEPSPLLPLPPGKIQPQGWLLTLLKAQRNGLSGLQEQISPFLNFSNSDWTTTNGSGSDIGWEANYWLRGYTQLGYCLQDPAVISNATRWCRGVLNSERPNGYFGEATNYSNPPVLGANLPMLEAMQSYYTYTGDTNAFNLIRNYLLWENSLPASDFGALYWGKMRMGDNIESVYWLYNRTGESWLLTLATNIYANMANWHQPNALPDNHNVNIAQGFRAPTIYWQQTGNPTQFQFAEANYQFVMGRYGQVPGGGFGADERCRFGYYGPRQALETCGVVELMKSFEALTRITGNPVWAERCEDIAVNTFPATMTTNLMLVHYLTAPNQPELDNKTKSPDIFDGSSPWFSYSPNQPLWDCCEHNQGMGWPYFCESTWLATWDDGLCASLYAPTTVQAQVGDGSTISVNEVTDYPFNDTVQLTLTATNGVTFPLYLRIPQWCSNAWIQVNGLTVATNCQPSSYLCLQRSWSNNDQVMLHFPRQIMVKTWTANNNCVSVNYGPLTFSLQIGENWQPYGNNAAPWTESEGYPATSWNYGLVLNSNNPAASFTVVTNAGPLAPNPFSQQTTPIYLLAQARKIPAWTLDALSAIGPVQPSPVYSTRGEETVTLVPMGAARLRLSAFPTVSTNATATRWSAPYAPSASYTNNSETDTNTTHMVWAMNDALEPASSSDASIPRMTWLNRFGTTEWAQAGFNDLCALSQVSVYWYNDGITNRAPQSWEVQYLAGTNWVAVSGASAYGTALNAFNTVTFNPVQTTAVRIVAQLQSGYSGGILEWQVPAEPVTTLAECYPLDGSLADVISSQTGNLYGGTFVADRFGVGGRALQLNGVNNYAVIPRPTGMNWTIAFWVKTTDTGGTPNWYQGKGLVDGEVGGVTDDFGVSLVGGKAAFGVGNPDTTITSTTAINDGQWHHLAATRNAYTGAMQLYVDGVSQASATGPFGPKDSPPDLRLGSIQTGVSGRFLAGTMDDVEIFNRVLSAPEISAVLHQSLILSPLANTNLIAGQTLVMSNSVVDPYVPPRTLTWSLSGAPAGMTIDPNGGVLTWRPTIAQSPSTNLLSMVVSDNGSPSLIATQNIQVVVSQPATPAISSNSFINGTFKCSVSGDLGPDYYIDSTTNLGPLAVWLPVFTNYAPAVFPFVWTNGGPGNAPQIFYRIRLGP